MIEFYVICSKCGEIKKCQFGNDKKFDLGQKIDANNKTGFNIYIVSCPTCHESIYVYELIKDGYFHNLLTGLSFSQKQGLENGNYPKLFNYPDYPYESRKSLLLGEDSRLIPSQYFTDTIFSYGDDVLFFDKLWSILETYKILSNTGMLFARVYKIRTYSDSKQIERLLILRDNYIPTLKEVNWSSESYKDGDDQFRRYKIPDGYEVIVSNL